VAARGIGDFQPERHADRQPDFQHHLRDQHLSGKVFAQTIDPSRQREPGHHVQATELLSKVAAPATRATSSRSMTPASAQGEAVCVASLTGTEQAFFSNKCNPRRRSSR